MTIVKFCGIRTEADVMAVNETRPDLVGMVFAPGRRRTIDVRTAVTLRGMIDPDIGTVGVFRDQPLEDVLSVSGSGAIDMIQLHGGESEDYVREIRERSGLRVIRAFTVRTREDVIGAAGTAADILMFDSGAGTGETFDWSILSDVPRPFILAGGLDPLNVCDAVTRLRPLGVDVSSGIETEGNKDRTKMRGFMVSVRAADRRNAE